MWGWNPDSFEAIGTVAAAFIALIAYFNSLRQKNADRQETRRRLAEQVTLTHTLDQTREHYGPVTTRYDPMVLTLTNHGPYPINRAFVTFTVSGWKVRDLLPEIVGTDPPVEPFTTRHQGGRLGRASWTFDFDGKDGRVEAGETVSFHYSAGFLNGRIRVVFSDNEGRRWRKYPYGLLQEGL